MILDESFHVFGEVPNTLQDLGPHRPEYAVELIRKFTWLETMSGLICETEVGTVLTVVACGIVASNARESNMETRQLLRVTWIRLARKRKTLKDVGFGGTESVLPEKRIHISA